MVTARRHSLAHGEVQIGARRNEVQRPGIDGSTHGKHIPTTEIEIAKRSDPPALSIVADLPLVQAVKCVHCADCV